MANRAVFRRTWLRLHRSYVKKMSVIFNRDIRRAAKGIQFDSLTESNFEEVIELAIPENTFFNTYVQAYTVIGLLHGRRIGAGINRELKQFEVGVFASNYRRELAKWLRKNAGTRIVSVRDTLVESLIDIIAKGIEDGKDIRTIARELEKFVGSRGFYSFQALRIARTEATAAANYSATIAGRDSGVVLEKEWISSNDARTRTQPKSKFDHIEVDGQKTAEQGLFDVQGDKLRFPGDPLGAAANTIQCRCAVALVPKRDAQGRLVFKE